MKTLSALPLEIPTEEPIQYGRKWARSEADVPKGRKIIGRTSSGGVYYETSSGGGAGKKPQKVTSGGFSVDEPAKPAKKKPAPDLTTAASREVAGKEAQPKPAPEAETAGIRIYNEIKGNLDSVSFDAIRDKIGTALANQTPETVAGILEAVGYPTKGMSKAKLVEKLVDNLVSLKLSREQVKQIATEGAKQIAESSKTADSTGIVEGGPVKLDMTKVPEKAPEVVAQADKAGKQLAEAGKKWHERFREGAFGDPELEKMISGMTDAAELMSANFFKRLSNQYGLPMAAAIWSTGLAGAAAGGTVGVLTNLAMSAAPGLGIASLAGADQWQEIAAGAASAALLSGGVVGEGLRKGGAWMGRQMATAPLIIAGDIWNGIRGMINMPRTKQYANDDGDQGESIDLSEVDMAEAKQLATKEWADFFAEWYDHLAEGGPLDDEDDEEEEDDGEPYARESNETIGKVLSLARYPMEKPIQYGTDDEDAKVAKVMREFAAGKLKSSSGETVTDRDQALAIAMSESGQSTEHYCACEACSSGQPKQYCMEGANRGKPGPCPEINAGPTARAKAGSHPSKAADESKGHYRPLPIPKKHLAPQHRAMAAVRGKLRKATHEYFEAYDKAIKEFTKRQKSIGVHPENIKHRIRKGEHITSAMRAARDKMEGIRARLDELSK